MCTATWRPSKDGYDLFFNRDELLTRKRALPPDIHSIDDISCIFPEDADAHGTWISVNQFGLSMCILNLYCTQNHVTADTPGYSSRGNIIKNSANMESPDSVIQHIKSLVLSGYQSFRLLILSPDPGDSALLQWNGTILEIRYSEAIELPLTSSSYRTESVIESRIKSYRESNLSTKDDNVGFHSSHLPVQGPYSVCMHRTDAKTVSFSHISVTEENIGFSYIEGNPCMGKNPLIKKIPKI